MWPLGGANAPLYNSSKTYQPWIEWEKVSTFAPVIMSILQTIQVNTPGNEANSAVNRVLAMAISLQLFWGPHKKKRAKKQTMYQNVKLHSRDRELSSGNCAWRGFSSRGLDLCSCIAVQLFFKGMQYHTKPVERWGTVFGGKQPSAYSWIKSTKPEQ